MEFVVDKRSGIIPFYFRLTDVSDMSLYTTATDFPRLWSITNLRTNSIEYFTTTSASINYCISAGTILDDTFTVSLSALIDSSVYSTTSVALLSSCGPEEPYRFLENRNIDLSPYVPGYLKETEFNELINFYQDFLNKLYYEKTYTQSATDYEISNRPKISIIEKINRIAELQDPSLIDIEYLQFFANNLGYSVDVSRGELGILANEDENNPRVQEDVKRYLRFVVENLPTWMKVKSTKNAIKIMLYSFGLIGDLITRYTNDYQNDNGGNWINFRDGRDNFANLPGDFYPTSHFVISIELDESLINFSLNNRTRFNVFNAVESLRPVEKVSDGFLGHIKRNATMYMRAYIRQRAYYRFNLN